MARTEHASFDAPRTSRAEPREDASREPREDALSELLRGVAQGDPSPQVSLRARVAPLAAAHPRSIRLEHDASARAEGYRDAAHPRSRSPRLWVRLEGSSWVRELAWLGANIALLFTGLSVLSERPDRLWLCPVFGLVVGRSYGVSSGVRSPCATRWSGGSPRSVRNTRSRSRCSSPRPE